MNPKQDSITLIAGALKSIGVAKLLIIVVGALIALGIYFYFKNKSNKRIETALKKIEKTIETLKTCENHPCEAYEERKSRENMLEKVDKLYSYMQDLSESNNEVKYILGDLKTWLLNH